MDPTDRAKALIHGRTTTEWPTWELSAWATGVWALYGLFAFTRDELLPARWQELLRLGNMLPSISLWTWLLVLALMLLALSVEGIHKLSNERRQLDAAVPQERYPILVKCSGVAACVLIGDELYIATSGRLVNASDRKLTIQLMLTIKENIECGWELNIAALNTNIPDDVRSRLAGTAGFALRNQHPRYMSLDEADTTGDGFFIYGLANALDLLGDLIKSKNLIVGLTVYDETVTYPTRLYVMMGFLPPLRRVFAQAKTEREGT